MLRELVWCSRRLVCVGFHLEMGWKGKSDQSKAKQSNLKAKQYVGHQSLALQISPRNQQLEVRTVGTCSILLRVFFQVCTRVARGELV
jgi:hypothetical protein